MDHENENSIEHIFTQARTAQIAENYKEARSIFSKILQKNPDHVDSLYYCAIACLQQDTQQLSLAKEAELLLSKCAVFRPDDWSVHLHWGIAVNMQGYPIDAIPHYKLSIITNPQHPTAYHMMARAFFVNNDYKNAKTLLKIANTINSNNHEYKRDLEDIEKLGSNRKRDTLTNRWPAKIDMLQDRAQALRKHVIVDMGRYPKLINSNTKVTTFGSCFAGNIARVLKDYGVNANNITIGEAINSTFANLEYVKWATGDDPSKSSEYDEKFSNILQSSPGIHKEMFKETDLFIITLGVAACFFSAESGKFIMPTASQINHRVLAEKYLYRLTTSDENYRNIKNIILLIRSINKKSLIVFSISPVPLIASFGGSSAVMTDCASKSILRAAMEQVLSENISNIYYWPSFEYVRWLGAYWGDTYGEEDGSTHHVSEAAIKIIIETFMEAFHFNGLNGLELKITGK